MDGPAAWADAFGAVRAQNPAGFRAWVRGLDPPIYVVGLMPPLVGAAATLSSPSPLPLAAALVATLAFLLLHAAVNLYNDAFDAATPADRLKRHSLARLASVRALHLAATCLLAVACAAGIALWTAVGGWAVLALSAAGVLLVFAYHAPPLRLSHRGWGEAVTFLGFGAVPVWTVAALADGTVPRAALLPGLLVGLAAALVLFHHNVASLAQDAAAGKRTIATRLGPRGSTWTARVAAGLLCTAIALFGGAGGLALAALAAAFAVWADLALARQRPDLRWASLGLFVAATAGVLAGLLPAR